MIKLSALITGVEKGSIAEKKKIHAGDTLISVNGNSIRDVLDYRFYLNETRLRLMLKSAVGKFRAVTVHKDEAEDIGLEFATYLMDKQQSCKNKCIFCFIDQLPEGLRDSLYFKDDDSRLSFLFGNYVTLTNMTDEEAQRIIDMHISPVNISVHTMNPELRVKMMLNPHAGESLKYLRKFAEAGVSVNTQLVLCPGINDGAELEYSLKELFKLYPSVQSIAAVPVGLTDHREGLYPLKPYDEKSAGEVIDIIDRCSSEFEKEYGERIAFAADEFYIAAGRSIPDEDYYNGFPQLENGVGMWALLRSEFLCALDETDVKELNRRATIVTGKAAQPLIKELAETAMKKINGLDINVIAAENKLFGKMITVSGLLCGTDIRDAVENEDIGQELIIPPNCLRSEGDMFLDNMTTDELSTQLGVPVRQNGTGGDELLSAMLGGN